MFIFILDLASTFKKSKFYPSGTIFAYQLTNESNLLLYKSTLLAILYTLMALLLILLEKFLN